MQMLPIPDVHVHLESRPPADVIRVTGDVDVLTMGPLMAVFDEALVKTAPLVIVDLTRVGFIDSSGLSGLLGLHRGLEMNGRRLMVAASPEVRRVVELAALDQLVELIDEAP